jgi:hypothetical protein
MSVSCQCCVLSGRGRALRQFHAMLIVLSFFFVFVCHVVICGLLSGKICKHNLYVKLCSLLWRGK